MHPGAPNAAPAQPIDIGSWTEEATQSLNSLSIASPNGVRGTTVSLAIDLDERREPRPAKSAHDPYRPRRKLLRRDSLERREALLKGKEGSRRRTRWENDRLLNNPWAQPPLPSDWEVYPTYPRHSVPYYLAPLWDQEMAARAEAQRTASRNAHASPCGEVPRELRETFKRAKAAKGLLRDLEEQVRLFMSEKSECPKTPQEQKPKREELDSSDEEIVFVGRNGKMQDMPPSPDTRDGDDSDTSYSNIRYDGHQDHHFERERLVVDSPANDRAAGFRRWLVHNIAEYYGLRTWSRTVGDPARREAYVGLPMQHGRTSATQAGVLALPRPLWIMV